MTLHTAPDFPPSPTHTTQSAASRSVLREARARSTGRTRAYEIAVLRQDGSVFVTEGYAPATPLFEEPFSAFAHGTLIRTTQGEIPVEDLCPGDRIVQADGLHAPLLWVGSSKFVPADIGHRTPLVRVMADSLGLARPSGFLTFGPAARILHTPQNLRGAEQTRKVFTLMRDLVDGVNIIEIQPPTPVRLYHLGLARHAAISVSGLEMETFHPGPSTIAALPLHQRDAFLSMFPHISGAKDFGPLCHPRASERSDPIYAAQ
ncbi:hypothetical protein A8B81_04000 [Sulfitobacter pontiacus]|uniref:Hint domain-containing protein n=1 Tax=Sulfitobacter pontiacus TaxID=60137 RepID=UPI0007D9C6FB|nr:Hint domain-containing protein [Sulfitobacter pontiacus]OAN74803.1 hypothetical protein A8B81_04000 [Sulfitobacter pontiacus]